MMRSDLKAALLLTLLATVPFLNKPVHIDDTFVLRVSNRILENPLDPFGGTIDWFGHELTVWEATTNPPFLSYVLSPAVWISNSSEVVLHLMMVPFFLLLVLGMMSLLRRFYRPDWIPLLFLVTGPAVLVSGNLMRDLPGLGLVTSGVAWFVEGVDRRSWRRCLAGSVLIGLAALTKYSLGIVFGMMWVYCLLKRRYDQLAWVLVPVGMMAGWCLHTWLMYGQIHPVYLLLERSGDSGLVAQDKYLMALSILGCCLLLGPVMLVVGTLRKRWISVIGSLLFGLYSVRMSGLFYGDPEDYELFLWVFLGSITLLFAVAAAFGDLDKTDSAFLVVWVLSQVLFSVFFIPFQAVRHLLPVLPALIILLFKFFENTGGVTDRLRHSLAGVLVIQAFLGVMVQIADYEYADSYRDFSVQAKGELAREPGTIWYIGHWGWKFYADREGFRQLHRDGPDPEAGDLLLWPRKVHIGDVFDNDRGLRDRMKLVKAFPEKGVIPLRTQSMDSKAGFYATMRARLPFRFEPTELLEDFHIYRIVESDDGEVM